MPESRDAEREILRALESLRAQEAPDPEPAGDPAQLSEKTMASVHVAIAAGDMLELATVAMVRSFIRPMLDVAAFSLGADTNQGSSEDDE